MLLTARSRWIKSTAMALCTRIAPGTAFKTVKLSRIFMMPLKAAALKAGKKPVQRSSR
jgi:hypothetical protein